MQEPRKDNSRIRLNFGFVFAGLLCIGFGAAYLLNAFSILGISVTPLGSRIVPLAIVFLGLALLSRAGRLPIVIGFVITLVSLGIIGSGIFHRASLESTRHTLETQPIRIPLEENIGIAHVYVTVGDGDITIVSGAEDLVEGEFTTNFTQLKTDSAVEDEIQGVAIGSNGVWEGFGTKVNTFTLSLNREVPIRLYLGSATAVMDVDLSDTRTEYVGIRGISPVIALSLGSLVQSQTVEMNTPDGKLAFSVPKETGVRIMTLPEASIKTPEGFHPLGSSAHESEGYALAKNVITIKLVAPVSDLSVVWR